MDRFRLTGLVCTAILACSLAAGSAFGQGGYNDDRVMIQGFMWESHQQGEQTGEGGLDYTVDWTEKWYEHVNSKACEMADAKFDLIWLPPPSQGEGAGYHPQQYHNFDNNYGTLQQHETLIQTLRAKGIEPIADLVVNHRNGTGGWATFDDPAWPAKYICKTDEFWHKDISEPTFSDGDRKIRKDAEKDPTKMGGEDYKGSNYPDWGGARDLDHDNPNLRAGIKTYLQKLTAFGYRGWRYDMVKGLDPKYIAEYNYASKPTFAVGEYWDSNPNVLTGWIDQTKHKGQPDPALRACSAFDFATQERLKDMICNGKFADLRAISHKDGQLDGLIAVNRDKAVTFLENHDTGFPQKKFDSFPNDAKLMQAYAYILTHPGLPCVFWKHYFEWKRGDQIKALIRARKYAGVNSGSYIKTEVHDGVYVAIVGDKPHESSTLIVKIGPGLNFKPQQSIWALETSGDDYAVWVRKSKKQEVKDKVDAPKPAIE